MSMQSKNGWYFSGGNQVATMEQLAQGSCYNKEMNFNLNYCDEHYTNIYPCAPGVEYYGRGFLPIYWYLPFQLHLTMIVHPLYLDMWIILSSYIIQFYPKLKLCWNACLLKKHQNAILL